MRWPTGIERDGSEQPDGHASRCSLFRRCGHLRRISSISNRKKTLDRSRIPTVPARSICNALDYPAESRAPVQPQKAVDGVADEGLQHGTASRSPFTSAARAKKRAGVPMNG